MSRHVCRAHVSKLRYYDGSISPNYYTNGAAQGASTPQEHRNEDEVEFCSKDVLCLGGEEEFELIMRGDFTALNRSDCALRFNEIFRWAWESWRSAVGNEIGTIYAKAIDVMNIGARANGKRAWMAENTKMVSLNSVFTHFPHKGYNDIADVWQQEVELPHLQTTIDALMQEIKPFHHLLHGILRNVLWNRINKFEPFNRTSTIPAHMLGRKGEFDQHFRCKI